MRISDWSSDVCSSDLCLETINYCLSQGGQHAAPEHIGLLATCADICATSAEDMLRGTAIHAATCGACAEVCRQCAESCARMGDDSEMNACAEAWRRWPGSWGGLASPENFPAET